VPAAKDRGVRAGASRVRERQLRRRPEKISPGEAGLLDDGEIQRAAGVLEASQQKQGLAQPGTRRAARLPAGGRD
jgi:hypothetical protein